MEHRRFKHKRGYYHIVDNDEQQAMILNVSTGNYQAIGPLFFEVQGKEVGPIWRKVAQLKDALDYLARFPMGNMIIKVDTIVAYKVES